MAFFRIGALGDFYPTSRDVLNEAQSRTRTFSSRSIRSGCGPMVFVSHKHTDLCREDIKGLLYMLEHEYHVSTYIDSKDWKMPDKTCGETAERIKQVINSAQRFILFATEDALRSMWCNWEVGVADKWHGVPQTMAILPILKKCQAENTFIGNEYLQLYPRIETGGFLDSEIVVRYPDNQRTCTLKQWLNCNTLYG